MSKLPGQLGGLVAMNAGVKEYEIFDILHSVCIDGKWMEVTQLEYGYRYAKLGGIVTGARFEVNFGYNYKLEEMLNNLRANQPSTPSAGSAFKNPPNDSAGRLIDAIGLKGYRKGDMAWSEVHANFLVNLGNGKFEDAMFLLELAKKRVFEEFGITLQEEIKVL
jgi:UDP-N-acetylmuramate dehydrogenase